LANADHLVQKDVKIDARKAGKRLTSTFKEVLESVKAGHYELTSDGGLRAGSQMLLPDEFDFRYVPKDQNSGVAVNDKLVVLLDLTEDPELVLEGYARDLNREIQDLRKRARLAYSDRIVVSIPRSKTVDAILDRHIELLAEQTLARAIGADGVAGELASAELDIGDDRVAVAIARAN